MRNLISIFYSIPMSYFCAKIVPCFASILTFDHSTRSQILGYAILTGVENDRDPTGTRRNSFCVFQYRGTVVIATVYNNDTLLISCLIWINAARVSFAFRFKLKIGTRVKEKSIQEINTWESEFRINVIHTSINISYIWTAKYSINHTLKRVWNF